MRLWGRKTIAIPTLLQHATTGLHHVTTGVHRVVTPPRHEAGHGKTRGLRGRGAPQIQLLRRHATWRHVRGHAGSNSATHLLLLLLLRWATLVDLHRLRLLLLLLLLMTIAARGWGSIVGFFIPGAVYLK